MFRTTAHGANCAFRPGRRFVLAALALVTAAMFALAGCQTTSGGGAAGVSPYNVGSGSGLANFKQRKLAEIAPYVEARRAESHAVISELAERLWKGARSSAVVASGRTDTIPGYPVLEVEDRDNDGRGEFYAYKRRAGTGDTREFGAYFDLSGDGQPDWIVFNGGPMFTKDMKEFFWFTNQGVDRDGDGRFDLRIINAIDMDGDGFAEKEASVWVYDDNGNGRADRAEHIVAGRAIPIRPEDGRLPLRYLMRQTPEEQPLVGGEFGLDFYDMILADILAVTRRGQ